MTAPFQELLLKSTNGNLSIAVLGECFGWIEARTWQDTTLGWWEGSEKQSLLTFQLILSLSPPELLDVMFQAQHAVQFLGANPDRKQLQ